MLKHYTSNKIIRDNQEMLFEYEDKNINAKANHRY